MSNLSSKEAAEVVCTLSKQEQGKRREELMDGIMQRIRRVRELSDGYAFGLDLTEEDEACARDFVAFETECCGFASYDVARDEAESAIWLSVRGPAGTKKLARQLVPARVSIEAMQEGDAGWTPRNLLRVGIAGTAAAVIGIVCCATPMLAIVLGVIGLSAAVASASVWLDAVAVPLLLVSLFAIGVASWRRRTARQI